MFVAVRDLRFARGRFVLIGSVVGLITVLVGFLSGLTGGLASQNVSAILALPADRIVFAAPAHSSGASGQAPSFSDSTISAQQAERWRAVPGVRAAAPIGIGQTRAQAGSTRAAVAVFGVDPGADSESPSRAGEVGLSTSAARALGVAAGGTISIARSDYRVAVVGGDQWYSHTPVVRMTLDDWRSLSASTGAPGAFATVLAVQGSPDWAQADAQIGTRSQSAPASLMAIGSFRSEIGSLLLMVVMLFGIAGLVIGAFFTVWTMQRLGDIAVLKALGASTKSLVRDALGQALVVLLLGVGVGTLVVTGLAALVGGALPFLLSPFTTVLPAGILVLLGLAGAAFALRSVVSADPLTALGSNR